MPDDDKLKISLPAAIALKHSLNQSTSYGPYNAKEFLHLTKLSVDDYAAIRKTHVEIFGRRPYIVFAGFIAGGLLFVFTNGWLRITGIVLTLLTAMALAKREGHEEGFVAGYENGVDLGIKRALRVSDEDSTDAHDRAIEMEIDEKILKGIRDRNR